MRSLYVWGMKVGGRLWQKIALLSWEEIYLVSGGVALRGWEIVYTLCIQLWWMLMALLIICFVSDSDVIVLATAAAIVLLLARASSVRKDMSYLFASSKTFIIGVWLFLVMGATWITGIWCGMLPWYMRIILIAPFGYFATSVWLLVWALWMLDTPPSLRTYAQACLSSVRMAWHLLPIFLVIMLISDMLYWLLLLGITQFLPAYVMSRCIVGLMILPWYIASVVQLYTYMRYREE